GGEGALGRGLAAVFVISGAIVDASAGVDELHFQIVVLATVAGRSLKREDVDDFLRAQHASEIVLEVIRILENLAAGGAGNGEETGVGVEVRSRLVVLHAHALDVDGVKHDVRGAKSL